MNSEGILLTIRKFRELLFRLGYQVSLAITDKNYSVNCTINQIITVNRLR
jgi:hypothetical protein